MSGNILVIMGICVTIIISIVNILGLIWVKDNTEEIVKGENEKDIEDHIRTVRTSLYGLSIIGGLTIIASLVQLYLIVIRDGVSNHQLTSHEYGNYTGVITIFSIFALIACVNVYDTIDPERKTDEELVSLFDFIKVLTALNLASMVIYIVIITNFIPTLSFNQPSADAKFDFNF